MINMLLSEAAKTVGASLNGEDIVFHGCSTDSRTIEKGNLFIALEGEYFDGHQYISVAEKKGASSLIVDREISNTKPFIKVKNTREAIGLLAKYWAKSILSFSFIRYNVEGKNNIIKSHNYVLVSNHQSGFDILVTFAALNIPISFFTKKEFLDTGSIQPSSRKFTFYGRCFKLVSEI